MSYDTLGRRISKETNGKKTTFTWDGDRLLSDRVPGEKEREFVYYPGSFVPFAAIEGNGRIRYYHNDIAGLPQEVRDEEGTILWQARYDAMGRVAKLKGRYRFDNPIRFQGQYYDEELGLCYNRHRYFDPETCAFISQDPLGLAAGTNLYAYASNVWGWVDPLGLCPKALPPPKRLNPWMSGTPLESYPVPKGGMEIDMAMSPRQTLPGGWGATDHIPDVNYVRQNLAVTPTFKPNISGVQRWLIPEGVQVQEGIAGSQFENGILYSGGGRQIEILNFADRSKLIPIDPVRPIY